MGTFYLGPLQAHDIDEIKRALQAHLKSIDDCIENGPVLTVEESLPIRTERARIVRLIDVAECLTMKL